MNKKNMGSHRRICRPHAFSAQPHPGAAIVLILLLGFGCFRVTAAASAISEEEALLETDGVREKSVEAFASQYQEAFRYLSTEQPVVYPLPGATESKSIRTDNGEVDNADDLTPQGVTVTGKYVIASAYSESKAWHSVLWVIDKKTGELLKTVALEGEDHVGGIADDPEHDRIWVTGTDGKNLSTVGCISLEMIEDYDLDKNGEALAYDRVYTLGGLKRTSFLAISRDHLYSGFFNKDESGSLCLYKLDEDGYPVVAKDASSLLADPAKSLEIPEKIQGITVEDDLILLSQSYGGRDSHVIAYENPEPEDLDDLDSLDDGEEIVDIGVLPYLEQICLDGNMLYAIFESGASAYSKKAGDYSMPYVLKFDTDKKVD